MQTKLFSYIGPDPASEALGTDFDRFETTLGIVGLCRIRGDQIDLLAILSKDPGKGNFRTFIERLKKLHGVIGVWEIMEPGMNDTLKRYGFKPTRRFEKNGEIITGWRWRKDPSRINEKTDG
jgi:hypothetical protein